MVSAGRFGQERCGVVGVGAREGDRVVVWRLYERYARMVHGFAEAGAGGESGGVWCRTYLLR